MKPFHFFPLFFVVLRTDLVAASTATAVQSLITWDLARFSDNKMLHERQVAISDFQQLKEETADSGVKQIMGAGKTTVVSPLSMLLSLSEL